MSFDPLKHHRHSIRLKGHDYTSAGAYFITICTYQRDCLFGEIVAGAVRLNDFGSVVCECWEAIPRHFPNATVDAFVVMPNHVHGVLVINETAHVGATHASPLHAPPLPHGPKRQSIGAIIGSFKSAVTKRINVLRAMPGAPVWQRNYYEHIVRNEREWHAIRRYIQNNPVQWALDRDHPDNRQPVSPSAAPYLREAGV